MRMIATKRLGHALLISVAAAGCVTLWCRAAIVNPPAPEGGRRLVYENVRRELRADPRFLGGWRANELAIAEPHGAYFVGLTDLASGHLLSAAKLGNWRYLLLHGTNAVGAAELKTEENTGRVLGFSALEQTRFADETLQALRIAEKLPQIKKRDYELRYLDIPGILFVAVWLHGKSDDIIIPLPPTFGRWDAYQPYSGRQMLKLLKPEAAKRLKTPKTYD